MRLSRFGSIFIASICFGFVPKVAHAGSALWTAPVSTTSVIQQTYKQGGGKGGLGEAQQAPTVWGSGCAQDFSGGRSRKAAIVVNTCDPTTPSSAIRSHIIRGELWDYTQAHGSSILGSPLGNDQLLDDGRWQTFSGGEWGLTDVYQALDDSNAYAVRGEMREWYQSHDTVRGKIGWPTSEQYEWESELRQDFQYGSLVWRAETGTRPLVSWSSGDVLSSPTVDPAHYLIRELHSMKIASAEQLNRCYGGRSSVQNVSPDELSLTKKQYSMAGNAPDCITPREQAALKWATQQFQQSNSAWSHQLSAFWSGRCETFVEMAYSTRGRATSAAEHFAWRQARGQIHTDHSAPAGTVVFYGGSSDGHTGISLGNGRVISTQGYSGDSLPIWQHSITGLSNPYLGWAYIDDSWPR